jgi:hypothetical protein
MIAPLDNNTGVRLRSSHIRSSGIMAGSLSRAAHKKGLVSFDRGDRTFGQWRWRSCRRRSRFPLPQYLPAQATHHRPPASHTYKVGNKRILRIKATGNTPTIQPISPKSVRHRNTPTLNRISTMSRAHVSALSTERAYSDSSHPGTEATGFIRRTTKKVSTQ